VAKSVDEKAGQNKPSGRTAKSAGTRSESTRATQKSAGATLKPAKAGSKPAVSRRSAAVTVRAARSGTVSRSGGAAPRGGSAAPKAPARSKRQAIERLHAAEEQLAAALPLADLNAITIQTEQAAAVAADETSPRTSPMTGEALPSSSELERIELANLKRAFAERKRLLRNALTVRDVAELLGSGRQTPHDRLKAGGLMGIKDRGQWRFPAWQFDAGGPDGVVAGLPDALRELRGPLSDLARIRWFITEKPLLGGRTPIEALLDGDLDDVVAEARAVGAS